MGTPIPCPMLAVVVSGLVIVAAVALVAVACFLAGVVLDRRRRGVDQQAQFLDGLRRATSRARRGGGPGSASG